MHRALPPVALVLLALASPACRRQPPAAPADPAVRFALEVVAAARSPAGIRADMVDEPLVEQVRRVQLVRRTTMDTFDAAKLLAAWRGETGPDRQYAVEDRPAKQRERASRGLRAALDGACRGERYDKGRAGRLAWLTGPIEGTIPDEIQRGQAALAQRLADTLLVRLTCDKGEVGLLLVPAGAERFRLVDVFETRMNTFEVHPDDPSQK